MTKVTKALSDEELKAIEKTKTEKQFFEEAGEGEVEYLGEFPEEETFELTCPLKVRGVEYRSLTARPLRGKDIPLLKRGVSSGADPDTVAIAVLTNTPIAVIDSLSGDDLLMLMGALARFLPQGFETEETD